MAELARDQHGVVSRDQLRALGFSEKAIDHAIATGRLFPVFRAAFGVGCLPTTRESRLAAAVLASGEGSVVSHGTAAALHGLWKHPPPRIDVIAPVECARKLPGIRRRFVPSPLPAERDVHRGVPCTTPSRTIVDVAGIVNERELRDTVEESAVRRMLNVPEIDAILDGPRRRGSRQLRRVLAGWRRYKPGLVVRSRMEAKLLPLLSEYGILVPEVNEKLRIGNQRFEIDFLWRRQRLAVETDGGQFHDNPEARARDAHRDRTLAAAGYRFWRLRWSDIAYRPEATMTELAHLLRDPRRRPSSPVP